MNLSECAARALSWIRNRGVLPSSATYQPGDLGRSPARRKPAFSFATRKAGQLDPKVPWTTSLVHAGAMSPVGARGALGCQIDIHKCHGSIRKKPGKREGRAGGSAISRNMAVTREEARSRTNLPLKFQASGVCLG